MKKIYYVPLIIAALIVFMGVRAQTESATKEAGPSKTGRPGKEKTSQLSGTKKILVAYFSRTGTTREIANQIHKIVGGDIIEIQVVETYPEDYEEVKKRAMQEQKSGFKPALKTKIENIKSYDLVFIGYPIWWGTIPAPIKTFLSQYDLSGKTIVPFCTHRGSGLRKSVADISELCPKSTMLEGKAVWARDAKTAQNEVSEWLQKIKITK
jgi:flavodoxin